LSYQWLLNGSNIVGATSSILTIPNVAQTNLGSYSVIVTNSLGSATSSNATLSMCPFIASPFTSVVAYWGKNATFSVQAWGTGPLSYQWLYDGIAIPTATDQTYTLTSVQFTNAGLYSVIVTSALGSATNSPAPVTVEPARISLGLSPSITINGVAGCTYIVQSTTNLSNPNAWITLTNLTLTQPVEIWADTTTDSTRPGSPKRFYQVLPGQ
jgi:hypothetical protein